MKNTKYNTTSAILISLTQALNSPTQKGCILVTRRFNAGLTNRAIPGVPCIAFNSGDVLSGTQHSHAVLAETNPGIERSAESLDDDIFIDGFYIIPDGIQGPQWSVVATEILSLAG